MERELWKRIVSSLRSVPRRRPRNGWYSDRDILAVLFWAALHDRSILWACQRRHWPGQAWRRRLPDQSTMSRRLRDPSLHSLIRRILDCLQASDGAPTVLIMDGKPLEVRWHTHDPDARPGWATGRIGKGYKLHLIIDDRHHVQQWVVKPMNESESRVACEDLVPKLTAEAADLRLLADANYNTNRLFAVTAATGAALVAPRRKPGSSLGHKRHHPDRLKSMALTEGSRRTAQRLLVLRAEIERFFGTMASFGGGLSSLPSWIRRLHRVRYWVAAKLAINAARIAQKSELLA